MAYSYNHPDPKESFRSWLHYQTELIQAAEQEGYTEDQAIEMLKIYALEGIKANAGLISGNY